MRIPDRAVLPFLAAALLAPACSGNSPPAPLVAVAGWSWDPAVAEDRPLPVMWWDSTTPQPLPLLTGGDCAASGSAQAMLVANGKPVVAGIVALCSSVSGARMIPVVWSTDGGGSVVAQPLQLPDRSPQGTALAVAERDGNVYVGGAVGVSSPFPMVWKNGLAALVDPGTVLPPGHDSGLVTSIVPSDNYVLAGGIAHVTGSSPPAYSSVVWILDPDFTAVLPELIPLPPEVTAASFGPSVMIQLEGTTVISTTALSTGPGLEKPVVWADTTAVPLADLDFGAAPHGVPTGLWLVAGTPYVSGFVRSPAPGALPQPVLWGLTNVMQLSTVDPSLGLGAGEAIAVLYEHAYVAGETYRKGSTAGGPIVSVAAWWDNGSRHDLAGLVPAGPGPAVAQPLFGWWRLPGTPSTAAPDWPYPGGFAEIQASAAPLSAAGSGVAKAIVVTPR